MFTDRHGHLRHDATRPDEWGGEMLGYLREHDRFFEQWRHEYLCRLDDEYRAYRRERAGSATAERRAPGAASPEPTEVATPLPAGRMDPAAGALTPDADAPAHKAALERFHGERA